jgi:hypothetical protein
VSTPPHLAGGQRTPVGIDLHTVKLVSGRTLQVMGPDEAHWFNAMRDTYMAQNVFSLTTDLQDLDRLLIHELMVYRWTQHLARGFDYTNELVDEDQLRKNIKEYSGEITKIKESMGLNKASRDKSSQESIGQYLTTLKQRAKEFGIHREKQLDRALTLSKELFSLIGTYDRADAEERRKLDLSEASILAWVREVMAPEFDEVDAHFRANAQKYWVREL